MEYVVRPLPFDAPSVDTDLKIGDTVRVITPKSDASPWLNKVGVINKTWSGTVSVKFDNGETWDFFNSSLVRIKHADGGRDYGSCETPMCQAAGDSTDNNLYLKCYKLVGDTLSDDSEWFVSTPHWIKTECDGWLVDQSEVLYYIASVHTYSRTNVPCRRLWGTRTWRNMYVGQAESARKALAKRGFKHYDDYIDRHRVEQPAGAGKSNLTYKPNPLFLRGPFEVVSAEEPEPVATKPLSPLIQISSITMIDGVNFANMSDDDVFYMIEEMEKEHDRLNLIRNKPLALERRLKYIDTKIKELVALLDERTLAATPLK